MNVAQLDEELQRLQAQPSPTQLAFLVETILDARLAGKISVRVGFAYERAIENVGGSPEISTNCINVAHELWDVIEWSADVEAGTDGYPLMELQDDLTQIFETLYRLKHVGWEPVYLRAYYDRHDRQRVVASIALTAYNQGGNLKSYHANTELHDVMGRLVEQSRDLDELQGILPARYNHWLLRDVVRGYALVNDFAEFA